MTHYHLIPFSSRVYYEQQAIADRGLSQPLTTAALVELKEFMKRAEQVTIVEVESKLRDILEYILFLSDYWLLSSSEIQNNNRTFQWYNKMPQIFEDYKSMVDLKIVELQDALKGRFHRPPETLELILFHLPTVRYQKFEEELAQYGKQVEELQYLSEVEDVYRYQKKAQNLENKLIAAMEKVDRFNEEETLFGWETTQYPERKRIMDRMTPFKKLFDSACEFLIKYDRWLNAMIGTYEPEEIDSEVGIAYRTIYKLEKSFSEPGPKELATAVREKIEEFKKHIPVIMTLGNPGMKARHWEQISEIIGFTVKVDYELTLGKVLEMGLNNYISRFEGISEAATKENNLEKNLEKMQKDWIDMIFTVNPYKDSDTFIIAGVDEIQLMLDDHITRTMTMKNSAYIKPFESKI